MKSRLYSRHCRAFQTESLMLSNHEAVLISILSLALVLIVTNRIRSDVVAILVLLALGIAGVVTPQEALSGFSRSAVVTIMGLFVMTRGLENTGVVQSVANRLRMLGGGSEARLIMIFMSAGALLSLVMNNIAAGAVLLPAATQVGRDSNVHLSKLLIPLSFGTLVGGMATYFTTANIVMSGILRDQTQTGLGMMDFVPTGGLIVIGSLVYMLVIGRRLLPERESVGQIVSPLSLSRGLQRTYQLDERLWEVRVPAGSRLENVTLGHSQIGEVLGVTVVAIWNGNRAILAPEADETIRAEDILLVLGREERVEQLAEWGAALGREDHTSMARRDFSVDLTEVIIPPRSSALGKTLKDLRFRNKYGLTSVALWREGRSYRTDVGLFPLEVGDALLMVGPAAAVKFLAHDPDFLVLQSSHVHRPPHPNKAPWSLLITILVLGVAIFNVIPLAETILVGAMAMVLVGCLSMDEAYRAIEWRVIFLIAGLMPVSIAMLNTGLANRIGAALVAALAPFGPLALIAGVYLLTVLVTQLIAGQVSALVLGPIAVSTALQIGVDPRAMAVAVAIACSTAFLTPIAHPVNILMMGPGGYTFGDFFKVGVGMTAACFLFLLLGLPLIWGIR